MENNKDKARIDELRKRAEKILTGKPEDIGDLAPADVQKLIQELNVHQIELELQNDDLRRTQLELQEAGDKYLNLYDYAPTGYHTLDSNGIILDVNLAGCELLGGEKHRLTGTQFTRYISPESQDAFYFHRRELIKTGTKSSCEIKMLKVDGTPFQAQLISSAISQDDRKTNHHLIAVIDISERKRAEEALRESEQRFFRLANNAQDMIYRFLTVSKREFEYVSPASTIVTGYTPEEYYADPDLGFKMVYPDDRPLLNAYLRYTGRWKESIIVRWIRKDGTLIWTEQRNVPIYDQKGELLGLEGIARDITQRKLMEEEIHRKEVEIAASIETDRLKTQLLSTVSHELRTPLASIKGYATMLMDYDKRLKLAEKRQCLELIDDATDRLLELIDHLIDMSRLDAGLFRLSKAPTNIDKLIDEAVVEAQIRSPEHRFRIELKEGLPKLSLDSIRIRQVLDNLLENTIRYSEKGTEVVVRAETKPDVVEITVADQGRGIPASEIDKVFDHMYRLEHRLAQDPSGLGLGLPLCKGLVEAHSGRIWIESMEGKVTTVHFTLPLETRKGDANAEKAQ